jgi:hypothetical protein
LLDASKTRIRKVSILYILLLKREEKKKLMYVMCMRVVAALAYNPCRYIYIYNFSFPGEWRGSLDFEEIYYIYIIYIIPCRFVDSRVLVVE